jgi:uncharacterized protein YecT (DUF1311 family)
VRAAILFAALALCVPASAYFGLAPAWADEADGIDCAHAMAQQDMNICADKDYRKADAELNRAYKTAMAGLDAPNRDLLRASERAWIGYRDAQCTFENAPNQGGSIYPLVYAGCLTTLTRARTKEIRGGQQ